MMATLVFNELNKNTLYRELLGTIHVVRTQNFPKNYIRVRIRGSEMLVRKNLRTYYMDDRLYKAPQLFTN